MYFKSIDKLNDFDQRRTTSGSSIKSEVLDLKTLPIFSPLKRGARVGGEKQLYALCHISTHAFRLTPAKFSSSKIEKQ